MKFACIDLAKRVLDKEKLTNSQWQLQLYKGFARRQALNHSESTLEFVSTGRIESGYELTEKDKKLAANK